MTCGDALLCGKWFSHSERKNDLVLLILWKDDNIDRKEISLMKIVLTCYTDLEKKSTWANP